MNLLRSTLPLPGAGRGEPDKAAKEWALRLKAYKTALSRRLTNEQWERAVEACLASCRFFPTPAEILEHAAPPVESSCAEAFEAVEWATVHRLLHSSRSVRGCECVEDRYDAGLIRERLGEGAYRGFIAAGGERAFLTAKTSDRPFLLKAFREGYVEAVKGHPEAAYLPARSEAAALPPAPAVLGPSRSEASGLVRAIEQRAVLMGEK